MVFFDHNATTPLWPEARAAWNETVETGWLNPSSPYRAAARAHALLETAREAMAALFGTDPGRLVFDSGATEGNNAVFAQWALELPAMARVGVGPTEHPSVTEAARRYFGDRVVRLGSDAAGVVDLAALEAALGRGELGAVSVMAANNETGVLQPWASIAAACRRAGVPYHCDASQWIGKLPLAGLGDCDYVTGCAHKFGGPRGVGFLVLPAGGGAFAGQSGGAQEGGRRSGTPDVAGIRAMAAALERAESLRRGADCGARDAFEGRLAAAVPGTEVVGAGAERLWNTVCAVPPRFGGARWIRSLEKRGYLISSGSACSTGKGGPSPVLAAMGVEAAAMGRAIRVSSGWTTTAADWEGLSAAFAEARAELDAGEGGAPGTRVISIS